MSSPPIEETPSVPLDAVPAMAPMTALDAAAETFDFRTPEGREHMVRTTMSLIADSIVLRLEGTFRGQPMNGDQPWYLSAVAVRIRNEAGELLELGTKYSPDDEKALRERERECYFCHRPVRLRRASDRRGGERP